MAEEPATSDSSRNVPEESVQRPGNRRDNELRNVSIKGGIAPYASGSVLISFGRTQVICAATLEAKVPRWMREQEVEGGWITAEYSMLPYSTLGRKQRDIARGKLDGRTVEIQRLIGRSLRAVCDLKKLPGATLWIDCDVLQADGGTRTAAITGAYVAARIATDQWVRDGKLAESPFRDSVAAVSVGLWQGREILDLEYIEDSGAEVDCNVVMTGSGQFVEIQGTGEEATFTRTQLDSLLDLAAGGINTLAQHQAETIRNANAGA